MTRSIVHSGALLGVAGGVGRFMSISVSSFGSGREKMPQTPLTTALTVEVTDANIRLFCGCSFLPSSDSENVRFLDAEVVDVEGINVVRYVVSEKYEEARDSGGSYSGECRGEGGRSGGCGE